MIRFCHSSIRYNTKFFKRRVTYYAGNLASYNVSVVMLEFFTSWDVQLNPGPSTVQLGSSGRRPSPAINSQSKSFSSVLINARSLKSFCKHNSSNVISNLIAFQNFVYHEDLDIVCVTETWLNDSIHDSEILPYNYTTFRQDRYKNRVGGGVLISVKSSSFKDVSMFPYDVNSDELEILTLLCTTYLNKKIIVCCCYRPPGTGAVWFEYFATFLDTISALNHQIIITGDFNLPQLFCHDSELVNNHRFIDALNDNFLHQINIYPTRNNNILDLLITNIPELLCITDIITPDQMGICSDHNGLQFEIQMSVKAPPKLSRYVYDFPKGNIIGLRNKLVNEDVLLSCISDSHEDLDLDWSLWKEKFMSTADKFIPKRKIKDRNSPPWINAEIRHLLYKKETIRRKLRSNQNNHLKQSYRDIRALIKRQIQESRSSYFDKVGAEIDTNPKRFWSLIKAFTKSSNCGNVPNSVSLHAESSDETTVTANNPQDITDLFNTYFHSVQDPSSFSNPPENDGPTVVTNSRLPHLEVTSTEVENQLKTINVNKAKGPNGIPGRLLKECAKEISSSLAKLFNKSLRVGMVPKDWKLANIIPLFKNGTKGHLENYRPISLLSLVSKILERCVLKRLLVAITPHLHTSQHGFLPGKSCTTQLLSTFDDIGMKLDRGEEIDILYTDMSKAFDTGVSGIPQGSILGPFLFLVYSNDILSSCARGAMYADDLKCYQSINSYDDAHSFQHEIDSVSAATQNCHLNFNESKCSVLKVSRKRIKVQYPYRLNESPLRLVNNVNDLGIQVTWTLGWKDHVYKICKKANKMLGLLRRCTLAFQKLETRRLLYINCKN